MAVLGHSGVTIPRLSCQVFSPLLCHLPLTSASSHLSGIHGDCREKLRDWELVLGRRNRHRFCIWGPGRGQSEQEWAVVEGFRGRNSSHHVPGQDQMTSLKNHFQPHTKSFVLGSALPPRFQFLLLTVQKPNPEIGFALTSRDQYHVPQTKFLKAGSIV